MNYLTSRQEVAVVAVTVRRVRRGVCHHQHRVVQQGVQSFIADAHVPVKQDVQWVLLHGFLVLPNAFIHVK